MEQAQPHREKLLTQVRKALRSPLDG